jgi:hypothetical protein
LKKSAVAAPRATITASPCGSGVQPDLLKFPVPQIAKQQGPLGIGHAKSMFVNLRIHVPIGDENIFPPVIVQVEKL